MNILIQCMLLIILHLINLLILETGEGPSCNGAFG
jgi:hypothetical protein